MPVLLKAVFMFHELIYWAYNTDGITIIPVYHFTLNM